MSLLKVEALYGTTTMYYIGFAMALTSLLLFQEPGNGQLGDPWRDFARWCARLFETLRLARILVFCCPPLHRQYTTFLVRLAFESTNTATVGSNLTQLATNPKIRIGSASSVD